MFEKIKIDAVNDVASNLLPTETAIDEALVHLSRLTISMVQGRERARLPIGAGQAAFLHVGEATTHAFKMRQHIARAHGGLAAVHADLGTPDTIFGPVFNCPDKETPRGALSDGAGAALT